jgi:hypothetical protein
MLLLYPPHLLKVMHLFLSSFDIFYYLKNRYTSNRTIFYNIVTTKWNWQFKKSRSHFPICHFFHFCQLPKVSSISTCMWTMSFSSNGTSSLCSKVEGEVVCSSPTGWVCKVGSNLLIQDRKPKWPQIPNLM